MKPIQRRLVVLVLFTALVLVLLWFQGILFHSEHAPATVPGASTAAPSARRAKVVVRSLRAELVLPGFVEAIDPAPLAARVLATIQEVYAREGDQVEAGALLVRLDDRDANARLDQARAALAATHSAAEQALLAFERAERLHQRDTLTTQDLEAARAANGIAVAQEQRAQAALDEAATAMGWANISAPFAGRVLARTGEPGQLAMPGQALVTLYRADRQRFAVAVPEERAVGLNAGTRHAIEFDAAATREATLVRILPNADPRTGTLILQLEFENLEGLRPGLMGRLRLDLTERSALCVPDAAVQRIGQLERVQLLRSGVPVPVSVRTGKSAEGWSEVLGGLREGDEVLIP